MVAYVNVQLLLPHLATSVGCTERLERERKERSHAAQCEGWLPYATLLGPQANVERDGGLLCIMNNSRAVAFFERGIARGKYFLTKMHPKCKFAYHSCNYLYLL